MKVEILLSTAPLLSLAQRADSIGLIARDFNAREGSYISWDIASSKSDDAVGVVDFVSKSDGFLFMREATLSHHPNNIKQLRCWEF